MILVSHDHITLCKEKEDDSSYKPNRTEGLVWYDRYKMILDCNRKIGVT